MEDPEEDVIEDENEGMNTDLKNKCVCGNNLDTNGKCEGCNKELNLCECYTSESEESQSIDDPSLDGRASQLTKLHECPMFIESRND
jgi:hypothetical protein